MNNTRAEFLLDNCISYLAMLKEKETRDEQINFWRNIIGMTDEEMSDYYDLVSFYEKYRSVEGNECYTICKNDNTGQYIIYDRDSKEYLDDTKTNDISVAEKILENLTEGYDG